ncbi:pyruvate dehydrogenase E1 component alpha subunit [Nematocida sp. LUAm3]|nr:pyruvate dehydrogenase E1 component alpha subunit [Nematocida sp. LUAm3]KAI5173544.1 pyruvate dehydrogenase E1 component alpha subunit [Nematocida sp. LUAm2]KAI5176765.1 pyruvate dehydrogenase E1 component alpha subunit [Nematocida sp. LUAm1]
MAIDIHRCSEEVPINGLSEKEKKDAVREILRIRHMEMALSDLYKERKIRGFCHLGIGQEAIAVGIGMHLEAEDLVITSYRCHSMALVSGMDPKEIFCELLGSLDGCAKGKGGSMHLYGKNFYGGHGIVGAQVPLGLGMAFSEKYNELHGREECKRPEGNEEVVGQWTMNAWKIFSCKNITVSFFGDGAANQGQIYEAVNMAALWNLPIVFVCENNLYGMGTAVSRASASSTFYDRFNFLPGIRANGSDLCEVSSAFLYARKHALKKGPILLELVTYRYNGHSMTDAFTAYRTDKEIEEYKKYDPLEKIRSSLEEKEERYIAEMNEAAHREMANIREVSLNAPRNTEKDLYTDILV